MPLPTAITLSTSAVTLDAIGDTALLVATVKDQRGNAIPTAVVTWASLSPSIVTANATTGIVTAVALGSADVRATFDTLVATVTVSVTQVPALLAKIAGDQQSGAFGTSLSTSLTVQVKDRLGTGVGGVAVIFAVTQGGGSMGAISVTSDPNGLASTTWTLGATPGPNQATASSGSLTPVTFTATALNLGITDVTPDPMVEGQSVTITGVGFDAAAANNIVRIGGSTATVTSASPTSLVATVGTTDCLPAQNVSVTVTVSGVTTAPVTRQRRPTSFLSLAVGQQTVLRSPTDLCVQLPASAGSEAYLIGVQSTAEAASSVTPATVSALAATAAGVPPLAARMVALRAAQAPLGGTSAYAQRWARHRQAEWSLRQRERALWPAMRARAAAGLAPAGANGPARIPPVVNVGDSLDFKFPNIAVADFCANFIAIRTVVRVVGTRGVWLEDVANPPGFSAADFQSLSDQLDNPIYDTDVAYFGAPSDLDGNGRVVIVVTKEANKVGVLGFVVSTDLEPSCASSNSGEVFYEIAPDPTGTQSTPPFPYSVAAALSDAPVIIAHELTHDIQFSRRLALNASFMSTWTAEGQAVLAEEVVGHAVEGRTVGQNLGYNVASNADNPASIDWYSFAFNTIARYYGYNDDAPSTRVAGAPEQCSFLTTSGPCTGGFTIYGVSWSLLRWISDQFGPSFPGGEQGLHKALVDNTNIGYANIASVVGASMDSLLPQWAAMLHVDDRVPGAAAPLTLPSWNLVSIENGIGAINQNAILAPRQRGYTAFSDAVSVRSGSSAYFLVSGAGRPATAIKARTSAGGALPSTMQLWVVRTQ
ncbi:MAG: IPT/TIG domain-containing protein [Gemmatimonadetes bacterium]|nr:IPT/TIG domain-containing protein [Gemmatimonadota bacterium]